MAAIPLAAVPVEIAAQAKAGTNRFEIRLDPPELGRIDVQLNVDKQGNVTSHLVVDRSSTLDLLRRDAPQLQRALQDAGLKTGSDAMQFSLRDQGANAQSQQQNFQNGNATRTARIAVPTDDVQPVQTASNYGRLYGATGGLDIRV
jgi:flagellar hook-length control protein FliK